MASSRKKSSALMWYILPHNPDMSAEETGLKKAGYIFGVVDRAENIHGSDTREGWQISSTIPESENSALSIISSSYFRSDIKTKTVLLY